MEIKLNHGLKKKLRMLRKRKHEMQGIAEDAKAEGGYGRVCPSISHPSNR